MPIRDAHADSDGRVMRRREVPDAGLIGMDSRAVDCLAKADAVGGQQQFTERHGGESEWGGL